MGDTEEYFPRGGKKPTTVRFKQSSNFLGGITQEDRKKKMSKKATENDDGYLSDELITEVVDKSYKKCGLWLNYKVVREGLLMLGRVQEVMETKLMISLPCRMQGMVMACHISEAYNQQLEAYVNDKIEEVSDLSKMFHRGQYVIVKVLEVTPKNQLMLSLMPQHINSGKIHSELHKGTIVQAAVTSVEDHGYIMDIGVPNTKVFLPKDSANPELQLVPGGVYWCVIKSVSASPDSSVVTLSGDLQYLQRAVQRHSAHNSTLMPGTALEFTVDKPLDNGIEGHVLDNITAYIQRHQVDSVRGKKPTLGQKIRARLLYCIPPNNIPYLTMKGVFDATRPDLQEEQKLSAGDFVEEAQVMKIMGRSVYMKLADKGLGLLNLRRIQVDENLSDSDVVAKSYPIGSIHKVRVLCYHLADHLYSVSDERHVLAEKYFSLAELQAGQFVSATVAEVADNILRVDVGRLKGVIPLSHMTETGISVDSKKASASTLSKKKFKVGQEVRGRVLQVDTEKHKLVLTLKPSLLQPDLEPLASYEQAQVGKAYTGVVKYIRDYLLVSFFNDVTAYVPRNFVTSEPVDNLADAFHLAQIVKCTILSVKTQEKKMSASLTTAPFDPEAKKNSVKRQNEDVDENKSGENKKKKKKKNKKAEEETDSIDEENETPTKESSSHRVRGELQAGQFVSATVAEVADNYLRVDVGRQKGIIPLSHTTETGKVDSKKASASTLSKKKFKVGQEVRGRVLQVDTEKHKLVLTLKPSLLQPDLEPLASYEQAQVGKAYTGVVKYIRDYLLVSFFNDVTAYVPRIFVTSEPVDNLADAFHLAQTVKCTILSVKTQEKKMSASLTTAPFDPEAKRNSVKRQNEDVDENESEENKKKRKKKNKKAEEEADNINEENKAPSEESSNHRVRGELQAGQFASATVMEVADNFLRVDVGRQKGIIPLSHTTETGKVDSKKASASTLSKKKFKVGQEVRGRVLQVDTEKHKLVLTLKPSLLQPDLEPLASYEQAQVGKAYTGVVKYIRDYLLVSFFNDVTAYVPRIFVTSEPVDNLADAFHLAQTVQCTILSVKPQEKKMSASLTTAPFDPEAKRNLVKRQNEDTKGRNGKKANLDNKQIANIVGENETHHESLENKNKKKKNENKKIKEVTNDIDEEKSSSEESDAIETDFHDEQQILVPEELNLIDFSDCVTEKKLKKRVVSLLKAIKARTHRLKRIEEKITKIETKGLHATNKKFHTAMHMEKIVLQERIGKLTEALEEGRNKLKELNVEFHIDKKNKSGKTKEKDDDEPIIPQKKITLKEKETEEVKEKRVETKEKRKEQIEHREVKSKEINVLDSLQPVVQVPSIKEFWLGNVDNVSGAVDNKGEESSSSDEEEEEKPKKKRKKLSPAEKVAKAREEEQKIRDMEKRAIESEAQPRSNEQFQRALLASPDSSQLWIAYMAFHLQATEIEKARAMARKALATINFREEQERLNVWLALLNLEHRFGNKESQQKTLEDALQMNDTYKVHTKLLDILVDTGKSQELSSVVELMLRRYRGSADVYRAAGAACYSAGLLDKARQVMQKGLAALEKKEHVTLLVNFAKLERSAGERERSEALFEQVLAVYPQRVDVASVYLDVLLKSGLVDQARQVLERLTSLQLPARKMKVLYKKWIEIEERSGDDAHIQSIRQRAKDFLDKAKF